jgi:glutathione synthase/RimK-type ligase-like ATP-grasp enzyme
MKKSIVIFEVEGGSDKWFNGLRKDTLPLLNAIKKLGWYSEIVFYRDEWRSDLLKYVSENFDGYINRINPGNLLKGEILYFDFLRNLSNMGLVGMSHPDEMVTLGSKDLLFKLVGSSLVPSDIFVYNTIKEFKNKFPQSLAKGDRVLKQNRGSTGVGIWRVELVNPIESNELTKESQIKCTEAKDNQVKYYSLEHFMSLCEKYIVGKSGLLIDVPYLPRIKEGEIRVLLVGKNPIHIIHKKPADAENAFSATLYSGAKYTTHGIEEFPDLINNFKRFFPLIAQITKMESLPLIWTADFIMSNDDFGNDTFILSEVNCSCVGFTNMLDLGIQDIIAEEAISRIKKHSLVYNN